MTQHLATAHSDLVHKAVCPVCYMMFSTIPNMRVHFKRVHRSKIGPNGRKMKAIIFDEKMEERVFWVWVSKDSLMNGRYYGQFETNSSSNSSDSSDEESKLTITELAEAIGLEQLNQIKLKSSESSEPNQQAQPIDYVICNESDDYLIEPDCISTLVKSEPLQRSPGDFDTSEDPIDRLMSQTFGSDSQSNSLPTQPLESAQNLIDCLEQSQSPIELLICNDSDDYLNEPELVHSDPLQQDETNNSNDSVDDEMLQPLQESEPNDDFNESEDPVDDLLKLLEPECILTLVESERSEALQHSHESAQILIDCLEQSQPLQESTGDSIESEHSSDDEMSEMMSDDATEPFEDSPEPQDLMDFELNIKTFEIVK